MKRPPLLHSLALVALAGAAVFLTSLTPSCDPRADAAHSTAMAQSRAFAAALHADPETQRAAAAKVAKAAQPASRAAATKKKPVAPPTPEMLKKARIAAARRNFLADQLVWESPEKAARVARLAAEYRNWFTFWIGLNLDPARLNQPDSLLPVRREFLDKELQDPSQLKPGAKAAFDEWEAKDWQGYVLAPHKEGAWEPDKDAPPEATEALADLNGRRSAAIRPLLDLLEWEGDTERRCMTSMFKLGDTPGPEAEAARSRSRAEFRESNARLYQFKLHLHSVLTEYDQVRTQWEIRGWDGYAGGVAPPPALLDYDPQ